MKKIVPSLLLLLVVMINACQRERSFEGPNTPATGTLQSDITGDCLPKTVMGTYEVGTPLDGANEYIQVDVDVTSPGLYTVYSDTVNGVWFRLPGQFTTTGINTIKLRGNGTPIIDGTFNFTIQFDGVTCIVPVSFLPAGAGGPATYTLSGSGTPASCSNATVSGTYVKDAPLTASNKVTLEVDVTTIGTYSITTTYQGMTFAGSGAFLTTGLQPVVLTGSGTPTTAGANVVPFTAGSSSCNFTINVDAPADYTPDCATASVNGTYKVGVPLDGTNTIVYDVNVATPGAYSISTSVNGMTFTSSGNLIAGTNTITLTGSGTPTASGSFSLTLPGTTPCTVTINVAAAPTIDWKFTDATAGATYQGQNYDVAFDNSMPPVSVLEISGDNAAGDDLGLYIGDISGTINANETYSSTATLSNAFAFAFTNGTSGQILLASPANTADGATMTLKVTSINTTTKTVTGTFSGTAVDDTNGKHTITNGTFTAVYP